MRKQHQYGGMGQEEEKSALFWSTEKGGGRRWKGMERERERENTNGRSAFIL